MSITEYRFSDLKEANRIKFVRTASIYMLAGLSSLPLMTGRPSAIIEDKSHYSTIMSENRNYRVFLPPDYYSSAKHYPVLYWFHGSGGSCKQETYRADFEAYVSTHDLIIINVDGTTPGGTTWDYGLAFEYERRTQEGKNAMTGRYFSKYIRELIGVIDSQYRTLADRDHRAVSGQSMGGLMAPWTASQNKDLFGSASLFSPSPDAAMFGPLGKEVCFTNRELYRSLQGIPLRITIARGDRYRQYYFEQKKVWEQSGLPFEYHVADYPDHKAVDIPAQFDFHMAEFGRSHPIPKNWDHADPFPDFKVWNYEIKASREGAAFTILEEVTPAGMLLCSRPFLPDGPLVQEEEISVLTDTIYIPQHWYTISDFNRSSGRFKSFRLKADDHGRLKINMGGGGHAIGITGSAKGPKLFLIHEHDREEIYCENGKECNMGFSLINSGSGASGPIRINVKTPASYLQLNNSSFTLKNLEPLQKVELMDLVSFKIDGSDSDGLENENFITRIELEVVCNDSVQVNQKVFVYPVPKTQPITDGSDLLILDGATRSVEIYNNQTHEISIQKVSGGSGNGNSIPEPGETIELYVRLTQGLGIQDRNTYHSAFLMNSDDNRWISVPDLRYNMRGAEWSGAPNLQSVIKIDPAVPVGTAINLWLKCECYDFSEEGFAKPVQRHSSQYRRATIYINRQAN